MRCVLGGAITAIAVASASIAFSAPGDPQSDKDLITAPLWDVIPAVAWPSILTENMYPARADRMHLAGRVVAQCRVNSDHGLSNCKVVEETPAGFGFGRIALLRADGYRIQGKDAGGEATRNRWVRVTIDFTPGGGTMAYSPGQDRTSGSFVRWAHSSFMPGYFTASYPPKAKLEGVAGHVVFRCAIGDGGKLSSCAISSEDPPGWGFGEAASKDMHGDNLFVKTTAEDGSSTAGRYIDIDFIFNPPCDSYFMPVTPGMGQIARPPPPGACGH
jgi:hypothetical protein